MKTAVCLVLKSVEPALSVAASDEAADQFKYVEQGDSWHFVCKVCDLFSYPYKMLTEAKDEAQGHIDFEECFDEAGWDSV